MAQFMIRRTLYALVTLFILSLTIFTVVRLTGDPVTLMADPVAQEADLALVRNEWGLDRPLPVQYAAFVRNIVTGGLGNPSTTRCLSARCISSACPTRWNWHSLRR